VIVEQNSAKRLELSILLIIS